MDNIHRIFFYMILYSFSGWVLESIYKSFLEKQPVNSGFLKGPFCPIYGFGALIMLFALNSLKGNIILLFTVSFVVLTIWEYIAGIILEKVFKTKYWDYTNNRFNINGRVCLLNSFFWGVLGVVFINYVHPFVENYIQMIPTNILLYVNIVVYILIGIDLIITAVTTIKFSDTVKKINELGEKIKLMLGEIKDSSREKISKVKTETHEIHENKEEKMKAVEKLKEQQSKLKINLYKTAKRLKLAFPSMKSETITNFLNEKIDIETLKKLVKDRGRNKR